jgi:hypothetical protein
VVFVVLLLLLEPAILNPTWSHPFLAVVDTKVKVLFFSPASVAAHS